MARTIFTAEHLSALQPVLQLPAAQRIIAKTVPIKQLAAHYATNVQRWPAPAGLILRTRETPDGVPLHGLQAYLRTLAPTLESLVQRNGTLEIGFATPPDPRTTAAVKGALGDSAALAKLQAQFATPTDVNALKQRLLDDSVADSEWLRLFRRYQVAQLRAGKG